MRVLIVDDSATVRRIIASVLQDFGDHRVLEAAHGLEALAVLADQGADLVITDWNMPNMGGRDFLRAIRADQVMHHLPVLVVSSQSAPSDIEAAAGLGVVGYVCKPFTADALRGGIAVALNPQASGGTS